MIDNIDLIKSLLDFNNENKFLYKMFIIKRKKDNHEEESKDKIISDYYIKTEEEYDKFANAAKSIADKNNARVYIELTKRCAIDVGFKMISRTAQMMSEQNYSYASGKLLSSVTSTAKSIGKKMFMIDYDIEDINKDEIERMVKFLKENQLLLAEIETVNGIHYVCEKFDINKTRESLNLSTEMVESIKKNPTTLLYCNLK